MVNIFLVFLLCLFTATLRNIKFGFKMGKRMMLLLLSIPLGSIFLVTVWLRDENVNSFTLFLSMTVTLGFNLVVFYLFDNIAKFRRQAMDKIMFQRQSEVYRNQIELLEHTQQQISMAQHDFNKHAHALKAFYDEGAFDKLGEYLKDIPKYKGGLIAQSGNIIVDSILNYKLSSAEENKITCQLELKIPKEFRCISDLDMNILLSNVLDNAITATCHLSERRDIDISIRYTKKTLSISVTNTFDGVLLFDGETRILTSKKDNMAHGYGLRIIEETVDKYNGTLEKHHDKKRFSVNIFMLDECDD